MTERASLSVAAAIAWLLGGCTPDLTEGHFACEDGRCPSGWFCRADDRCYSSPGGAEDAGGGGDAGRQDAGPIDAGGIDGGTLDAGPTDAGEPPDAGPPTDAGPCDPVMQTGCGADERCALVGAGGMYAPACAARGPIQLLEPCTPPGEGTPDDCEEGLLCVEGACRPLCSLTAGACPEDFACSAYSGFPEDVGSCVPTCDPVTQARDYDNAAACASLDVTEPSLGCYGQTSGPFFCVGVIEAARARTHRVPAGTPAYLNSCAPGFMPLLMTPAMEVVCVALCDPEPTYSGNTANAGGLSPFACADRGATSPTEECRFFDSTFGMSVLGPEVGLCLDYAFFGVPSCASFDVSADSDSDTIPDYVEAGCGPLP